VELCRRTLGGEAGAHGLGRAQVFQLRLDEVRQLEVVEKEVEELLPRQAENEIILAFPVGAAFLAPASGAAFRFPDDVSDLVLPVAGEHEVALARVRAEREARLTQSLRADADIFAPIDLGDLAAPQGVADGLTNLSLRATKKALTVPKTLGLGIETTVDDVHAPLSTSSPRLLDPHVPLDEPANLPMGIPAGYHAVHEFLVLFLGLAIFLRAEADHRQQVLDLAEHPLLDDLSDFLVRCPVRVLPAVLRTGPQREFHDLVTEILRVRDAGRLLDL